MFLRSRRALKTLVFGLGTAALVTVTDVGAVELTGEALVKQIEQVAAVIVPGEMTHAEMRKNLTKIGCYLLPAQSVDFRKDDPFVADLASINKGNAWGRQEQFGDIPKSCFDPFFISWHSDHAEKIAISLNLGFESLSQKAAYGALVSKYGEPIAQDSGYQPNWWIFVAGNCTLKLASDDSGLGIGDRVEILPSSVYKSILAKKQEKARAQEADRQARAVAAEKAKTYQGRVLGFFTPGETDQYLIEEAVKLKGCSVASSGKILGPCVSLPGNPEVRIAFSSNQEQGGSQMHLTYSVPTVDPQGRFVGVPRAFKDMQEKLASDLQSYPSINANGMKLLVYGDKEMVVIISDGLFLPTKIDRDLWRL